MLSGANATALSCVDTSSSFAGMNLDFTLLEEQRRMSYTSASFAFSVRANSNIRHFRVFCVRMLLCPILHEIGLIQTGFIFILVPRAQHWSTDRLRDIHTHRYCESDKTVLLQISTILSIMRCRSSK